jgi:hypothetical protein
LTVTRKATISGSPISNGTLNVINYNSLQNTTFNGTIPLIKADSNNDDTSGGNIYNGQTTIRNNDNSQWRHGYTNGDIFNSIVILIKESSGDFQIVYTLSEIFNDQFNTHNLNPNNPLIFGLSTGITLIQDEGLSEIYNIYPNPTEADLPFKEKT